MESINSTSKKLLSVTYTTFVWLDIIKPSDSEASVKHTTEDLLEIWGNQNNTTQALIFNIKNERCTCVKFPDFMCRGSVVVRDCSSNLWNLVRTVLATFRLVEGGLCPSCGYTGASCANCHCLKWVDRAFSCSWVLLPLQRCSVSTSLMHRTQPREPGRALCK